MILEKNTKWGAAKCKVLEMGTHEEEKKEWNLGDKTIENSDNYKYLGEIISRDGKNDANLSARFKKLKSTVRAINTSGKSHIMQKIEIKLLITLHNAVTLPTLLYNSETWPLNSTIRKQIDQMEIWAWKSMLGLPKTTPTPAIIYSTGSIYASIRVEMKQLIYLHKVLSKGDNNWAKVSLKALQEHNIGFAKQIYQILEVWGLNTDWDMIKRKSAREWKREVLGAAEKRNKDKLKEDCHARNRGEVKIKTKTKVIVSQLENPEYTRNHDKIMNCNNKLITRAYIMGRFGMLQCAANFSNGYGGKDCRSCGEIDNESHRINHCNLWDTINLSSSPDKINFEHIHSINETESMKVVERILLMWDLANGRNCMRT